MHAHEVHAREMHAHEMLKFFLTPYSTDGALRAFLGRIFQARNGCEVVSSEKCPCFSDFEGMFGLTCRGTLNVKKRRAETLVSLINVKKDSKSGVLC
jgi:hypothetical protein